MKYSITALVVLTSHLILAQSGWVKEKNKLYFQVSNSFFEAEDYYSINGDLLEGLATFTQNSLNLYGEYGLGHRLAIEYNHIIYRLNGFETTETVSGFGDAFLGLKYAINKGKFPISFTVGPEFPIGTSDLIARNIEFPDVFLNLPTGDGEWNVLGTLAISHSIKKLYFSLFATYNWRTEFEGSEFSDQFRAGAEVGYSPLKGLWLQGKARLQATLGDELASTDILRGEGTEFSTFEVGASYTFLERYTVVASTSFFSDLFVDRKNVFSAPIYGVGVAYSIE